MEYFIGSIVTLVAVLFIIKVFSKSDPVMNKMQPIKYSQSHMLEMLGPFAALLHMPPPLKETQATKLYKKMHIRIILADNKAYWILDNAFYEADIIDGIVDKENAKVVDTMGMDKVQLDKMIFIVEQLTEGLSNDSGNSGK